MDAPPLEATIGRGRGLRLAFWQQGARAFDVSGGADDETAHLIAGGREGRWSSSAASTTVTLAAARAGIGGLAAGRDV